MRPLYHPSLDDITVEGILHALSDPVRAHILARILRADGAQTCSAFLEISDRPIPKSTLSQHFKALREAGLIRSERKGVELHNTSRCQELAARFGETAVAAAASRVAPTHSLRLSFHEARCALEAVRLQNGDGPDVASYEDLGAFQLLLSLQDDDALISYCRGVLGPVEQGEGDYGDELLRSLDVFIEHNGHWEKAASALYCHRHTLRYRIRRIEQLTGRDFSHARDRIEFWLALRGRELAR